MLIQSNSKLLFIGDSITDCGRAQPIGEGRNKAHGEGYVAIVNAYLGARFAERRIRVVNMGTSGHTVKDLQKRWRTDVLDQQPAWLSIMIGINDVWRQFDMPLQPERHVYLDDYERILDELVQTAKPGLKGLVLMTPFFIERNKSDAMRAKMDEYGRAVKKLAKAHGALCVDTQAAFDQVLKHDHSAALAWDRVHPSLTGHMVLARAFLNAVGAEV